MQNKVVVVVVAYAATVRGRNYLISFCFFGCVLRRDDGHVLRKVLSKRKRGRPKKTWKTQVEKESKSVGLDKEDAMN